MPLCVCGAPYYPDSTGEGPCHESCEKCHTILDKENSNGTTKELCIPCFVADIKDNCAKAKAFFDEGSKMQRDKHVDHGRSFSEWFAILHYFLFEEFE